jgi:hypothetical protein
MKSIYPSILAFTTALFLTACASKTVQPAEYSGYLGDYTVLEEVKASSGTPIMRWINPDVNLANYSSIYIKPTVLYPEPQTSEKVSAITLQHIARRCDQAAKREHGKVKPLAKRPGPGVLVLAPAITAATAHKEGLKPYEVIPIALIAAGVSAAAGTRDEESNLYMEFLVTDGATGKPVAKTARKLQGEELENSQSKISGSTFDAAIDQAAADGRALLQSR